MIVLGGRATSYGHEGGWRTWIQNVDEYNFPDFNFRFAHDEAGATFTSLVCQFNDTKGVISPAHIEPCPGVKPDTSCRTVRASHFKVGHHDNNLACQVVTNNPQQDQVLGFEIFNNAEFGFAWSWLTPNENTWVLLTPTVIKTKSHGSQTKWRREVVYHTTVTNKNSYKVNVKFNDFHVMHFIEEDLYDRWMSVGDIGGFAFFLYILHTAFMFIVGFVLDNDSKFLTGGASGSTGYNNL